MSATETNGLHTRADQNSLSGFRCVLTQQLHTLEEQLIQQYEHDLTACVQEIRRLNGQVPDWSTSTPQLLKQNAAEKAKLNSNCESTAWPGANANLKQSVPSISPPLDKKEIPPDVAVQQSARQAVNISPPEDKQAPTPDLQGQSTQASKMTRASSRNTLVAVRSPQERWSSIVSKALEMRHSDAFFMKDTWQQNLSLLSQASSFRHSHLHHTNSVILNEIGLPEEPRTRTMSPTSYSSLFWTAASLLLVAHDLVMVPVVISFDCGSLTNSTYSTVESWWSRLWWTLDMFVTFRTGVYVHGEVIMDPWVIARRYLQTWFFFDFLLVIGEWLTLLVETLHISGAIRFLRIMRYLRIMRFNRAQAWIFELVRQAHRGIYLLAAQCYRALVLNLMLLHIGVCLWHKVGLAGEEICLDLPASYFDALQTILFEQPHRGLSLPKGFCVVVTNVLTSLAAGWLVCQMFVVAVELSNLERFRVLLSCNRYIDKHNICLEDTMAMVKSLDVHHKRRMLKKDQRDEIDLFTNFPCALQVKIHVHARYPTLNGFPFLKDPLVTRHDSFLQIICNEAMIDEMCFQNETVFQEGRTCQNMICIETGDLRYWLDEKFKGLRMQTRRGRAIGAMFQETPEIHVDDSIGVSVVRGDCLCEASLWTNWKHRGEMVAASDGNLLLLGCESFARIVSERKDICFVAVQHARQCVHELNVSTAVRSDLENYQVEDTPESDQMLWSAIDDHLMFLSHYKIEAGTEAALMMEDLEKMIKENVFNPACNFELPVFVDSEGLDDLNTLSDHVRHSHNLVLLLTPGIFSRVWCLVEIVTAFRSNVDILPVEIQKPGVKFQYPDEDFFARLRNGEGFSETETQVLLSEDITFDQLEGYVRDIFKKIAKPFSPHKSMKIRTAELADILERCPCRPPHHESCSRTSISKDMVEQDSEESRQNSKDGCQATCEYDSRKAGATSILCEL